MAPRYRAGEDERAHAGAWSESRCVAPFRERREYFRVGSRRAFLARSAPKRSDASSPRLLNGGFTYIGILVAVVIMGIFLTLAARVWSVTERRERETQLLFVGDEFRMAISGYYANGHQYPLTLESLLADDRYPVPKRYLRRLYADPITGSTEWTLIRTADGSGIMGVASRSTAAPIKRRNFSYADQVFEDSDCYCSWQFVYVPKRLYTPTQTPATTFPGR